MKAHKNPDVRVQAAATFFFEQINSRLMPSFVIVVIPPSQMNDPPSGTHFLAQLLAQLPGISYASDVLIRIADKPRAHEGGDRGKQVNLDTLEVRHPKKVKGKRVLILDDTMKSGVSMDAALEVIVAAGPAHVERLALECTRGVTLVE